MALGREVGDAYISVHGDLSDFRRDLDRAGGAAAEKAAMRAADDFSKAWGDRIKQDVNGKWDDILTAMYSDKSLDWDRLIGNFDSKNMDEAQSKIMAFTEAMAKEGKLTTEQQEKFNKALQGTADLMRERAKLDALHSDALRADAAWDQRRADTMDAANKENERWARTLDGIRKNNAIGNMESDFRKLAETMSSMDMEGFAKGFDSLHQARARIYEVTAAMQEQGRMSQEQADIMHANIDQFINDQAAKSKAMKDALDETNRLRDAQDRYNKSLDGMARTFHFGQLENDFRNLAAAMDSNDWSHFARGADDIDQMRDKISGTAFEMHRLGRMTDEEFTHINENVKNVTHSFDDNERSMGRNFDAAGRLRGVLSGLNGALRGTREHLQGFAGLNVFGDMMQEGLDFIHNLDRIALKASQTALKLGSFASVGGSALAGIVTIAGDVAASLGGLSALLPAFATGAGLMAFVTITGLKSISKEFKATMKEIEADIGDKMFKAMDPALSRFKTKLLPTLKTQLGGLASAMGALYGSIFDAITTNVSPADMALMFKRLDDAILKSRTGVKGFVSAWATLGLVGSKYFDRFAGWINNMGTSFDKFIKKAAKSGELDKWIEAGIKGFKDLGRVIDGSLGIFNAVESAARAAGSGGLSEFADKLQAAAKAMQEQGFQKTLTTLFEGMNTATGKIGDAIRGLGPAMQSVMPSVKTALTDIGTVAAGIIGYIGDILSNPTVQQGITDFSSGMKTAMERLEPAIKPFSDSLGNAMTLLGKVIVAVADIATAFTVTLGPVLDKMSAKVQTLIDPLSDMATRTIKALKPVAEALDKFLVGPVVAALKSDLIPAFNGFVDKAAPVLGKIVKDLGPVVTTLVKTVLPNLVRVATELLDPLGKVFDLFTPTLENQIKKIGDGFGSLAAAMRLVKGEARPEDWKLFDGGFSTDDVEKNIKDTEQKLKDIPNMNWGDILKEIFTGDMTAGFAAVGAKIDQFLNSFADWLYPTIADGWDKLFGSGQFWKDAKSNNMDLSNGIQEMFKDQGAKGAKLDDTVNQWLEDNLVNPLKKGWDDAWKGLGEWWDGVKSSFQDFMSGLLGFDTHPGKAGSVSGGGGAGGKGTGVSGAMDPTMFGLPSSEGVTSYFTQLGTDIRTGITDALGGLGEMLGLSDFPARWNEFWGGFGTVVSEAWTNISTWVTTKYTEISTNITNFLAGFGASWDQFWGGFGTAVSNAWNGITTWITTKYTEISTNISGFIATVSQNWNTFWAGVGKKVSDTWTQITTWVSTKVGEIRTNISNFITTVTGSWNTFWAGVGTKVSTTWAQITGWISGQIGSIRGSISGFIGSVTGSWNSFWTGVGQRVSQAWTGITTAVSTGVQNVMGFIRGLPGQISGALGNLWGLLQGAGAAIMGGLQRGLEAAWGGVQSFVGGIADWIAQHKGPISYDRTLLVPAGEAIMGGLESSLKDKFGGVMDFVSSMADLMAGAFAHSKMYLAGADAALGLADGLASQKSTVLAALGAITPDTRLAANITGTAGTAGGVGGPTPVPQKIITIEKGAVQFTTSTQSPDLVAEKVIDGLVSSSAF